MLDQNTTRHILKAQAMTLVYEARQWPQTADVALRYVELAQRWASKHQDWDLFLEMEHAASDINYNMQRARMTMPERLCEILA